MRKTLLFVSLTSLVGCAGVFENATRGYNKEVLPQIYVSGAMYDVERRTRVMDESQPAIGDNVTVAVWTKVKGSWVYCGVTADRCKRAIRKALEEDRMNSMYR